MDKNTVENISLTVCMASRVAVVGANGAGKSTAIKLLIGELKPELGSIWRHQNMRLAYVAQHAFHHLEKHLDKTATDYIMWRFAGADDKESLENMNMETTDDDEKKRERPWFICPKSLEVKKCDMTDTAEGKKERAAAVLLSKPLTGPGVEKALKDFGLDAEAASHSPLGSLSHGQRVKVVICASCWQNPHIIILDEPTNYLDRDGLGALVRRLDAYQ